VIAAALSGSKSESDQILALNALDAALDSSTEGEGEQGAQMILRLLRIGLTDDREGLPVPSAADAGLIRMARALGESDPDRWRDLLGDLARCIVAIEEPALKAALHADAGLQLSHVNVEAARGFFLAQGHFLPESAFVALTISSIANGGATMLEFDPPTGHRLLEIAERRCKTATEWTDLFRTLLLRLKNAPPADPLTSDHLVNVVERAVERVPETELRELEWTAFRLYTAAPAAAGRLLRLDPDEDRMRGNLIRIAKDTASVDIAAARDLAFAAERMVLSILDESEQTRAFVDLAEAFAAIDPGHAIRLAKSLPDNGRRSAAITRVATVFAASFPDQVETLIAEVSSDELDETQRFAIYEGIARADPARAMRLATPLPDSIHKRSIISRSIMATARIAPEEAEALAFNIQDSHERAQVLDSIVFTVARDHPQHAADLARQIPTNARCARARTAALIRAGEALAAQDPDQAEELLALAEHAAAMMEHAYLKGPALCDIAGSYTKIGVAPIRASKLLAQAEQFASMGSDGHQTRLLLDIMVAWAAIAPRQAERIAAALPAAGPESDMKFRYAAVAMAPTDPRLAEQFALRISDPRERLWARRELVAEFCRSAPARAERLAIDMEPSWDRTHALLTVAQALHRRRSGE
jgi:hypothetical protein